MKLEDPGGCDLSNGAKVWSMNFGRLRCNRGHIFHIEECQLDGKIVSFSTSRLIEAFNMILNIILKSHNSNEPTPFDNHQGQEMAVWEE